MRDARYTASTAAAAAAIARDILSPTDARGEGVGERDEGLREHRLGAWREYDHFDAERGERLRSNPTQ